MNATDDGRRHDRSDASSAHNADQLARQLIEDARRRGMSIVGQVADRFTRMMPGGASDRRSDGGTAHGPSAGADPDPRAQLRDAQVLAERAVDAALDALSDAFSLCADVVERAMGVASDPPAAETVSTLHARCESGGTVAVTCWLHNTTGTAAPPLRVHVGELRSAAGNVLDATVTVLPGVVERLEAGASTALSIAVATPARAAAGSYHALVFADGLDDAPLRFMLRIDPTAATSPTT